MNSFKSTCVVLVLAGVLYGVYVTLHAPPNANQINSSGKPEQDLSSVQPPSIDFGPAATAPSLTPPPSFGPPPSGAPTVTVPASVPLDSVPPTATASYVAPDQGPIVDTPVLVTPTTPPSNVSASTESPAPVPESTLATPATPSPKLEAYKLKMALQSAEQHVQDGKFRDALATLSPLASNTNLTAEQRTQLFSWLDALAAKVIYSSEHHLVPPHRVQGKTETLYEVAGKYKVDALLLQNINAQVVSDPIVLVPGSDLKVLPGPFRAEANLSTGELTLYLGQLYAGRFAYTIGEDQPKPGTYHVHDKRRDRVYYGRDGRQLAANDPANPYGGIWIDLGSEAALHGSPASASTGQALGCLSFSPQDATDLFAILNQGAEVVIKR